MDKFILEDELSSVTGRYVKFVKRYLNPPKINKVPKHSRYAFKHCYVISDNNPLGRFAYPSFISIKRKGAITSASAFCVGEKFSEYEDFDYTNFEISDISEMYNKPSLNKTAFMIYIDCNNVKSKDHWLETIRKTVDFASKGKKNMCIVSLLLPDFPAIPYEGITSLSEREFGYFMERTLENPTPEQRFFVEIESLCRELVNNGYENINISRVANLFGPDSCMIRAFDLEGFIKESYASKVVNINTEDASTFLSVSYLRDAFNFSTQILYCGRTGHIYNFRSHSVTIAKMKLTIHDCFKETLALKSDCESTPRLYYHTLNTLKFFQCGWNQNKNVGIKTALYRTYCDITGEPDNNENNIAIYSGKLPRIKDLELMMLRDIDALCEANGIKYFLCGGTMLGAVRYGHSIPWDDDLDIGMLRKDFDKFRKVSLKDQNHKLYNYSSNYNKSGSHYIVDKVRLNNTYFSTRYSSVHEYDDGLFIDVLVYDQTSNIKAIGMLHSRLVHILSKIIELRWYNKPRKGPKRKIRETLMLPILRIFPIGFYHGLFEFVLKLYKNKKNAKYVIDSTGKLQKKGPFSIEGLEDVQRVDFDDGFQAPIPIDYTNYLTFDYGPNYLPEPPLSKRAAPHNFARIDLGEYIFETDTTVNYRKLDVRGELHEKEV